jgi:hypothetical protein
MPPLPRTHPIDRKYAVLERDECDVIVLAGAPDADLGWDRGDGSRGHGESA